MEQKQLWDEIMRQELVGSLGGSLCLANITGTGHHSTWRTQSGLTLQRLCQELQVHLQLQTARANAQTKSSSIHAYTFVHIDMYIIVYNIYIYICNNTFVRYNCLMDEALGCIGLAQFVSHQLHWMPPAKVLHVRALKGIS